VGPARAAPRRRRSSGGGAAAGRLQRETVRGDLPPRRLLGRERTDPLPARGDQLRAETLVGKEPQHRVRPSVHVVGGQDDPRLAEDLGQRGPVGCDHGTPHGHRLGQREAETLVGRWVDERHRVAERRIELVRGDAPHTPDVARQPELHDRAHHRALGGSGGARQHEDGVVANRDHFGERLQERPVVLVGSRDRRVEETSSLGLGRAPRRRVGDEHRGADHLDAIRVGAEELDHRSADERRRRREDGGLPNRRPQPGSEIGAVGAAERLGHHQRAEIVDRQHARPVGPPRDDVVQVMHEMEAHLGGHTSQPGRLRDDPRAPRPSIDRRDGDPGSTCKVLVRRGEPPVAKERDVQRVPRHLLERSQETDRVLLGPTGGLGKEPQQVDPDPGLRHEVVPAASA